ncbi:MAG: hypothetical protein CL609_09620 [Anaerolineaceae bacterium]|nr:hypothetical protein [Anaerolineaceae bacterium]
MKILVFYDGTCPFCVNSARVLKRLDWFNQLDVINMYTPGILERYAIDPQKALQRIQVRTKFGTIREGLAGITYISLFLPLLWILVPFMAFSQWIGLGQKLYDWIAKNRLLFPVPGYCPLPGKETIYTEKIDD